MDKSKSKKAVFHVTFLSPEFKSFVGIQERSEENLVKKQHQFLVTIVLCSIIFIWQKQPIIFFLMFNLLSAMTVLFGRKNKYESTKPPLLSQNASLVEFANWIKDLQAYFKCNNLHHREIDTQHCYFCPLWDSYLKQHVRETDMQENMRVLPHENEPSY